MSKTPGLNMKQRILIVLATVAIVAAIAPLLRDMLFTKKTEYWQSFIFTPQEDVVSAHYPNLEACTTSLQNNNVNTAKDFSSVKLVCGLNCRSNGYINVCEKQEKITLIIPKA